MSLADGSASIAAWGNAKFRTVLGLATTGAQPLRRRLGGEARHERSGMRLAIGENGHRLDSLW
jgi:hypothetical protein